MTMNQEDTFKLDDVPIPKLPERENLEKEIIETIQTMPQGKSFFVPIDSKKKQNKTCRETPSQKLSGVDVEGVGFGRRLFAKQENSRRIEGL
jgi:hypothetical protein